MGLEARWAAADQFRANSGLKAGQYSTPVLGLIFLRFAEARFAKRRADREVIEELRRFARGEAYDEQAIPELSSEAPDFRVASESFALRRKLERANLETLRLVTPYKGRKEELVLGTSMCAYKV